LSRTGVLARRVDWLLITTGGGTSSACANLMLGSGAVSFRNRLTFMELVSGMNILSVVFTSSFGSSVHEAMETVTIDKAIKRHICTDQFIPPAPTEKHAFKSCLFRLA
jgi:hypothetical protein